MKSNRIFWEIPKKKKIGKIKSLGSKIKFNRYPTPIEFHKLRPNKQNLFLPL